MFQHCIRIALSSLFIWSSIFLQPSIDWANARAGNFLSLKLAEAYGLAGWRVQTLDAFRQAIAQALDAGRPCIVECMLGIDEMVAPMVAPGAPIDSFCLN